MDSSHCESMNNVKFTAVILIRLFASILSLSLSPNICISQFNSKNEKTKMTEMTQTTAAFSP